MSRALVCLSMLSVLFGCGAADTRQSGIPPVKHLRVNGVELAYVEEGHGTTVLFVHGAVDDWRQWDALRPFISTRYRFVSMSRRYHHPNTWADDGQRYTFDEQVDDVATFIQQMNVGKVHLVGNSYSGRLVGTIALRHPQLLRTVVLGEPGLAPPTSTEGKAAASAYAKDLAQAAAAARVGDHRNAAMLLGNAVRGDPLGFSRMSQAHQQRWLENANTLSAMFRGGPPAAVTCAQLKKLEVPALAVRGENTRENFKHGHNALLACLPGNAESVIIREGTHHWNTEFPAEAAARILEFVSRH